MFNVNDCGETQQFKDFCVIELESFHLWERIDDFEVDPAFWIFLALQILVFVVICLSKVVLYLELGSLLSFL